MPDIIKSSGSIAAIVNGATGSDDSPFTGSFPGFNQTLHTRNGVVRGAVCPTFGIVKLSDISLALNKLNAFGVLGLGCPSNPIITQAYRDAIVSLIGGELDLPQMSFPSSFNVEGYVSEGEFTEITKSPEEITGVTGEWAAAELVFEVYNILETYESQPSPGSLPPETTHVLFFGDDVTVGMTRVTETVYATRIDMEEEFVLITTVVIPGLGLPGDVPLIDVIWEYPPGIDGIFVEGHDSMIRTEVRTGTFSSLYIFSLGDYTANFPYDVNELYTIDWHAAITIFDSFGTEVSDSTEGGPPGEMTPTVNVSYTAIVPKIITFDANAQSAVSGAGYGAISSLIAPYNCT